MRTIRVSHSGRGTPSQLFAPKLIRLVGIPVMLLLLLYRMTRPPSSVAIPSVITIALARRYATTIPLAAPMSAPAPTAMMQLNPVGTPAFVVSAATMNVDTIALAPAVRSNWPAMNGIRAPSAAIVTTAWFSSVVRMFADVRKVPDVLGQMAKKTISTTRKITNPYCSRIVDSEGRGRLGSPAAIDLRFGRAVSGSCCSVVLADSPGDRRDQTPAGPANDDPRRRGWPTPRPCRRGRRRLGPIVRVAHRRR